MTSDTAAARDHGLTEQEREAGVTGEQDVAIALDLIQKAYTMVSMLNNGERDWMMSIPARPDYDPDLVIGHALQLAKRAIDAQAATIATLTAAYQHMHSLVLSMYREQTIDMGDVTEIRTEFYDGWIKRVQDEVIYGVDPLRPAPTPPVADEGGGVDDADC